MASLETPGQVITFYSYKGGTGRTMALANVACLMAQRQNRSKGVLMVDWDLDAPGLHRYFQDKFQRQFANADSRDHELDEQPGLIDLFWELDGITPSSACLNAKETKETANAILSKVELKHFIIETDIPSLYLLKAGRFNDEYPSRVNTFQWEAFYNRAPYLIRSFAELLAEQYQYVFVDSRTGVTDTSGICTMLMPEKLVLVFTPNHQSLIGALGQAKRATNYRMNSDDLRPLVIFPLPSRIEAAEPKLREKWRLDEDIGYQPRFEKLFKEVYGLPECRLDDYFDKVQVQHSSYYAYGEEIAVEVERRTEDSLSLARSYKRLTEHLVKLASPWEDLEVANAPNTSQVAVVLQDAAVEKELGNYEGARHLFEQATEANPKDAAIWRAWAILEKGLGNYEEARRLFEQATEANPKDAVIWRAWAILEKELGNYEEARRLFKQATELNPKDAVAWQNWAILEKELGNYEKARDLFRQSTEADPKHVAAWQSWAVLERQLGNHEEARRLFKQATELNPKDAVAWQNWAILEKELGNYEKARRFFERATGENPKDTVAWQALVLLELELGNNQVALSQAQQAVKLDPNDYYPYVARGKVQVAFGQLEQAEKDFQQAKEILENRVKRRPKDTRLLNNLGQVFTSLGAYQQAKTTLNKSLEQSTVHQKPYTYNLLGELYKAQGMLDEARKEWEKALEYLPHHLPTQNNLKRIYQ